MLKAYVAFTRLGPEEWGDKVCANFERRTQDCCADQRVGMYSHVSLYFENRSWEHIGRVPNIADNSTPEAASSRNVLFDILADGFTGFSTFLGEDSWYRRYPSATTELYEMNTLVFNITAESLYAAVIAYLSDPLPYNDSLKYTASCTPCLRGSPLSGAWCCPLFYPRAALTTNCVGGTLTLLAAGINIKVLEDTSLVLRTLGLVGIAPAPSSLLPSKALTALQRVYFLFPCHVATLTHAQPTPKIPSEVSDPLPPVLLPLQIKGR